MKNFFRRLLLVFMYGPELNQIVRKMREDEERRQHALRSEYLQLCIRHQPVSPGSHFSEHNCDYCKLLAAADQTHRVAENANRLNDQKNTAKRKLKAALAGYQDLITQIEIRGLQNIDRQLIIGLLRDKVKRIEEMP